MTQILTRSTINLAVSCHGYGDEGAFDHRASRTRYRVLQPTTGKELLALLAQHGTILNLKIFSHSYPRGVILSNWSGFYHSPGPSDNELAAYLDELGAEIRAGRIRFAFGSVVALYGCNLANEDYARKFSEVTGGTVIASQAGVHPQIAGGRETGFFISGGSWEKFVAGRFAGRIGKHYRGW